MYNEEEPQPRKKDLQKEIKLAKINLAYHKRQMQYYEDELKILGNQ